MFKFRVVEVKGSRYARIEDVVEYVRDMAAAEETDVRDRFNAAADEIAKLIPAAGSAAMPRGEPSRG